MTAMQSQRVWRGNEIKNSFPQAATLEGLIEEASKEARQDGDIVCSVYVNGMTLSESDEIRFAQNSISEIFEFSVKRQSLQLLLAESRVESVKFLDQLKISLEKSATLFRAQDLIAGHKIYRVCIDGVQLFIEMMNHYKIAYKGATGNPPFSASFFEGCLLECLQQVLDAYGKKNYSLVADLLEYELSSKLDLWQRELKPLTNAQDINASSHSKAEFISSP